MNMTGAYLLDLSLRYTLLLLGRTPTLGHLFRDLQQQDPIIRSCIDRLHSVALELRCQVSRLLRYFTHQSNL